MYIPPMNETEIGVLKKLFTVMRETVMEQTNLIQHTVGFAPEVMHPMSGVAAVLPEAMGLMADKLEDWPRFKPLSFDDFQRMQADAWAVAATFMHNHCGELDAQEAASTMESAKRVFDVKSQQFWEMISSRQRSRD